MQWRSNVRHVEERTGSAKPGPWPRLAPLGNRWTPGAAGRGRPSSWSGRTGRVLLSSLRIFDMVHDVSPLGERRRLEARRRVDPREGAGEVFWRDRRLWSEREPTCLGRPRRRVAGTPGGEGEREGGLEGGMTEASSSKSLTEA